MLEALNYRKGVLMVGLSNVRDEVFEENLARLTDAAYRRVLDGGAVERRSGGFLELQLGIWKALRSELERVSATEARPVLNSPRRSGPASLRVELLSWRT